MHDPERRRWIGANGKAATRRWRWRAALCAALGTFLAPIPVRADITALATPPTAPYYVDTGEGFAEVVGAGSRIVPPGARVMVPLGGSVELTYSADCVLLLAGPAVVDVALAAPCAAGERRAVPPDGPIISANPPAASRRDRSSEGEMRIGGQVIPNGVPPALAMPIDEGLGRPAGP